MSVLLAFAAAFLFATGTWMLLQRRLSRILIGVGLVGHGANILLLTSGGGGGVSPIIGTADASEFTDPLPQALVLTSIVITFGVTAFLLALGYRSWRITTTTSWRTTSRTASSPVGEAPIEPSRRGTGRA